MIDTAKLRVMAEDCARKPSERAFYCPQEALAEELTPAVVLALLDELEALRAERDRLKDIASATSCSLELALARVQEHGAKLDAWRTATGCDTPEEAARVVSVFDEATHLARGQREELTAANRDLGRLAMRQQAELDRLRDRLRELEQHVLAKRWDAAIAACRRAKEGA